MRWLLCLFLLALAGPALAAEMLPKPETVPGWPARGEARQYTPKTLFEYIDGAADLFLSYGFEGLTHGDYGDATGEERLLSVDVYDMGAPVRAFGVFASERPEKAKPLDAGLQGYVGDGLAAFWQDRYYVKVSAVIGATDADAAHFAEATAPLLPPPSGMPAELSRLPAADRIKDSERYTHQSALGHKVLRQDVSAQYRLGKAVAELHLADLGTPAGATEGLKKLRSFESSAGKRLAATRGVGEEGFAVTDASFGEFVAARRGQFVAIAFGEKATRTALTQLVREAAKGL